MAPRALGRLLAAIRAAYRAVTYRQPPGNHPNTAAALHNLQGRRPQDWDPWARDGRPR